MNVREKNNWCKGEGDTQNGRKRELFEEEACRTEQSGIECYMRKKNGNAGQSKGKHNTL